MKWSHTWRCVPNSPVLSVNVLSQQGLQTYEVQGSLGDCLVRAIEKQASASLTGPSSILIGNLVVMLAYGELHRVFRGEENKR